MTSFGFGRNLDVVTDEFELNQAQVKKLTETFESMTMNEVVALALALGSTKFLTGLLAIAVNLVTAGNLIDIYTYLVLAEGKMNEPIGLGEVLFLKTKQNYTEPLLKLRPYSIGCYPL